MNPLRIQLSRKKGWRMPANTVKVARPTRWGNPCRIGMYRDYTAADAVADYRRYIARDPMVRSFENAFGVPPSIDAIRATLRGKNLACFCALDQPCHADVLLEIANA
jgi:hypothetical protein